jgi:hypothetical protein
MGRAFPDSFRHIKVHFVAAPAVRGIARHADPEIIRSCRPILAAMERR